MSRGLLPTLCRCAVRAAMAACAAEPLDAGTCAKLKGEQVRWSRPACEATWRRVPQWAKANLAADKLRAGPAPHRARRAAAFPLPARSLVGFRPRRCRPRTDDPPKADDDGKDPASPRPRPRRPRKESPVRRRPPPAERAKKAHRCQTQAKEAAKAAPTTAEGACEGRGRHIFFRQSRCCGQAQGKVQDGRCLQAPAGQIPLSTRSPTRRRDNKWAWGRRYLWPEAAGGASAAGVEAPQRRSRPI